MSSSDARAKKIKEQLQAEATLPLPFGGDLSRGRWGWRLKRVRRVKPTPFRGQRGLFHVAEDVLERLEYVKLECHCLAINASECVCRKLGGDA